MPISASDPRYLAEYIPGALQEFINEARRRFALPASHVGAKGDLNHSYGYHRSRNWIVNSPDSRFRLDDYSIQSAPDRAGDGNWLAAVDISIGGELLKTVCQRLKTAADARDPRLTGWREFLGTLDGVNTYGWDFIGHYRKTPDRSHLWHLHLSRQRQYCNTPMLGILDVMLGDDMLTPDQQQQLSNIHDWLFDFCRGLTIADAGTPHIARYVPNEILTQLRDRPAAVGLSTEDRAAIVADLKAAVVGELADLLPSAAEIKEALDAAIEERLNGATIHTTGH